MSHCRSPNRRLFLLLPDAVLMKFLGIAVMAIFLLPAFASAVPEGVLPSSDYVPAVSENAASYGNGYRYNMNGFIYVHIEGDAYERGYQHGYLLYPEIMDMLYRWSNVIHNCPIVLKYVHLNESSSRYEKISGIWWNYCRNKAMNIFWDKYPAEYKSEIKGIADAVAARGGEMFGEKVTYEDILTLNEMYELMSILVNPVKSIHPLRTLFYDLLGAAPELENKENEFISSLVSYPPVHHCDGFIATGDATTNGQVVATDSVWCGGWWYTYYIAQRWNIILDIVPAQGNRIIIGTSPGYIWSDEDYWQNDKGIILIETTCPQGLWKKNGMPLAIRTRMAMQYGENIDDVIRYMRTDSNGVMNAVWLIGDTKSGEIARFELGLYESAVWRTKNGFYWSANNPMDPSVRKEQLRFESMKGAFFRVLHMLFNTSGYEYYTLKYFPSDRDIKFEEFGNDNYGKIDVEEVKKLMSNPPITDFSTDCKITDSYLISKNGLWTFWGNPHGDIWNTSSLQPNLRGVVDVPPAGWARIYGLSSQPEFFYSPQSYEGGEAAIEWDYSTDGNNFESASGVSGNEAIYLSTNSGKMYAFDDSGNLMWNKILGESATAPAYSNEHIFVATDGVLYSINANGDIEWSFDACVSSRPAVNGDTVIVGTEDGLYCISAVNGKEIWHFETNTTAYPSNVINKKVYAVSGNTCYAVDVRNGKNIWTFEAGGVMTSPPYADENGIYFGSWDNNLYALSPDDGDLKWKYEVGWGIDTTPVSDKNLVFFGSMDNNFYAVDKESGKLEWAFTCRASVRSSPEIYGYYVFFGADDGHFYALNKTNGRLVWSFSLPYSTDDSVYNYVTTPIESSPEICNGNVIFGAGGHIYALDTQTRELPSEIAYSPSSRSVTMLAFMVVMAIAAGIAAYVYYKKGKRK